MGLAAGEGAAADAGKGEEVEAAAAGEGAGAGEEEAAVAAGEAAGAGEAASSPHLVASSER